MDKRVLVNNIKRICQEQGVSISQLEKDLYMSPGLISRWARNVPALDRVLDIANYFGISLDVLVNDASANDTNSRTINSLLNILYQKTINADLEWEILDLYHPIEPISEKLLPLLSSIDADCFYCTVNNGYFFLVIQYEHSEDPLLSLYVLATPNSYPEMRCSNTEKLSNLYQYLQKRLSKRLNTFKTDQFIADFIDNNQADEDIDNKSHEKITHLNRTSNIANG